MPDMAVVHEWIDALAGSEQVFLQMAQTFPDADLYALSRRPGVELGSTNGRRIRTTFLDNHLVRDRRGLSLPLMPAAWKTLTRKKYDLVLTSHHAFAATNSLAKKGGAHLAYVHSPARYLWTPELDERGKGLAATIARPVLQSIDKAAAKRLTRIAANSFEVAERIQKFWGRSADVIHPPVDVDFFSATAKGQQDLDLPNAYLLSLGRWIPYKNHSTSIQVARLLDMPLVVAGSGPLRQRLESEAKTSGTDVYFYEQPARTIVRQLLQQASVLLFPTREDFGIVPVEAMAAGTPVVALAQGGAVETVVDGVSGVHVQRHAPEAYAAAVEQAAALDPNQCKSVAKKFSPKQFQAKLRSWAADTAA